MKTLINIKADSDIKVQAQQIAKDLGIPLSTIINAFLKEFVRKKEIYFSTSSDLNPEFEAVLAQIEKDIQKKKNLSPKLRSTSEVSHYLDSL